jgi:hypothetical protein
MVVRLVVSPRGKNIVEYLRTVLRRRFGPEKEEITCA